MRALFTVFLYHLVIFFPPFSFAFPLSFSLFLQSYRLRDRHSWASHFIDGAGGLENRQQLHDTKVKPRGY